MEYFKNTSSSGTLLSVVIVSYNVSELLSNCLISLRKYLTCPYEVIVIDNASTDNTKEVLVHDFPDVSTVFNSDNVGFSAANNQGLQMARGEKIFFLNPDTELIDERINEFFRHYSSPETKNTIAGPKLLNTDGTDQQSTWRFPRPSFHFIELLFLNRFIDLSLYKFNYDDQCISVDFVSGAALLIDRENAIELGGFDANLFWMDDVDLCQRHTEKGNKVEYYPAAILKHHSGQSGKKNYKIQISNQILSKLKYYKKNKQFLNFYLSVFIFFFHIVSRFFLFLSLSPINNTYFKKFVAYAYTFRKFFQFLFFKNTSIT